MILSFGVRVMGFMVRDSRSHADDDAHTKRGKKSLKIIYCSITLAGGHTHIETQTHIHTHVTTGESVARYAGDTKQSMHARVCLVYALSLPRR